MKNTYTYTARSARNPEQLVTFTLYDDSLMMDVGALMEHAERALEAQQVEGEKYPVQPLLKPLAISVIERGMKPFSVADVYAHAENGGLLVTAWVRTSGLRLAPVIFTLRQVDNPDAAKAFVKELEKRKASVDRAGSLPGILDYWMTWFVGGFSVIGVLMAWLYKKYSEADA